MPHQSRFSVGYNSADGYVITDSTQRCGVLKCGTLALAEKICDALNAAAGFETHEERDARLRHTPGELLAYALDEDEGSY